MRIAELAAYHVRIPLKKTIRHASHTRTRNDTLIVRCRLSDGSVGWGEGLPRSYVTGETIDSVWTQLGATDLRADLGESFAGLPEAITLCGQLQLSGAPANARDCFGNTIRSALELGVLDAACRAQGVPLSNVTREVPETAGIRHSVDRVRYSGAITPMGAFGEMYRALKLRYYGFHQCKVKVGVAGINDTAALWRIRKVLGPEVALRIDANEAWTCENLEQELAPLLRYDITSVEQPVPHDDVDRLAALRKRIDVPIMLDESLCSLSDAHRAVERGTCDLFNIRLSKCGGFVNSLQTAAIAHRAGLGYQLGCQVGETGILSAAGRHFASSIAEIRSVEGSFDRFLVAECLTEEDLTFRRAGYAPALSGPGLGITIDTDAVRRVTVKQLNWRSDDTSLPATVETGAGASLHTECDWIAFDAVGTVIHADPPVATVYHAIGTEHGSRRSVEEIRQRFQTVFRNVEQSDWGHSQSDWSRADCLKTSDIVEIGRWRGIVHAVFDDVDDCEGCFQELLAHFGRPDAWRCYPDVKETLAALSARGFRLALASNFDSQLNTVVDGLAELEPIDCRVISSIAGYRKPSLHFYRRLTKQAACPAERILMVGDDFENDVAGALAAGLRAVHLCRKESTASKASIRTLSALL
jgi:muconate cycloisomerase